MRPGPLADEISVFIRRDTIGFSLPPWMHHQGKVLPMSSWRDGGHLQARERTFNRMQPRWHPDLRLSGSRIVRT